jgi:hypothetical protein
MNASAESSHQTQLVKRNQTKLDGAQLGAPALIAVRLKWNGESIAQQIVCFLVGLKPLRDVAVVRFALNFAIKTGCTVWDEYHPSEMLV